MNEKIARKKILAHFGSVRKKECEEKKDRLTHTDKGKEKKDIKKGRKKIEKER